MYHWIRPEILIPVHGEARHLHEHRRFALEQGVPKALAQENGEGHPPCPRRPQEGRPRAGRAG
jgi:ribonuclease J